MMKIFINIFGVNFGNKWDKISEDIAKKNPYLEQSETLLERGNRKPNP